MKALFLIVLMALAGSVMALDACYTGSWYDPAAPGEGISVEVLDEVVLVYFYRADVQWFAFQGDGEALTAYQPFGGGVHDVGDGFFIPRGEDHADFGYDILLDLRDISFQRPIPWCLRWDCADEMALTRLTQPIPCE